MQLRGASLPSIPAKGRRPILREILRAAIATLFATAAIVAMAGGPSRDAAAAGPAILTLPASTSTGVGVDINIDIAVSDIVTPGLGGYVVAMQWDPSLLSLTSLADSGWVTGGDIIVICTAPTIDNVAGNAELDCTPVPLPFGDGVTTVAPHPIANAVFHTLATGTTSIDLTGSSLLDPLAVELPGVTITNGSVEVVASVGGSAREPEQAALRTGDDDGGRGDALPYGAGVTVALAATVAGGWWIERRRRSADH